MMKIEILTQSTFSILDEIRCRSCNRMLFKWHPTGLSTISIKCPRCGMLDTVRLSTG